MQFRYVALVLLAPLALAAPTPVPSSVDLGAAQPVHALVERQQSSSSSSGSSIFSSLISALLPIGEQLFSALLPTLESMITSALKKRDMEAYLTKRYPLDANPLDALLEKRDGGMVIKV